jgi:hypothetical protein
LLAARPPRRGGQLGDQLEQGRRLDLGRVERDLRAKIADWRGLLSRNVAQARPAVARPCCGDILVDRPSAGPPRRILVQEFTRGARALLNSRGEKF